MFIYYRRGNGLKSGGSTKSFEGREDGVRKILHLIMGVYENNIDEAKGGSTKITLIFFFLGGGMSAKKCMTVLQKGGSTKIYHLQEWGQRKLTAKGGGSTKKFWILSDFDPSPPTSDIKWTCPIIAAYDFWMVNGEDTIRIAWHLSYRCGQKISIVYTQVFDPVHYTDV